MGGEGTMVKRPARQSPADVRGSGRSAVGGETAIDDDVIASIAAMASSEVEGVASLDTSSIRRTLVDAGAVAPGGAGGVEVEQGVEEAVINLTLKVYYGYRIPDIVNEVRGRVADRLIDLTGIVTREINIEIADIVFSKASDRQE